MSPNEALHALEAAPALAALREGELKAGGHHIGGTAEFERGRVSFRSWHIKRFQLLYPLTARVQLDLSASRHGCTFTVEQDPPTFRSVGEFRSAVIVALISFGFAAYVYVPAALIVLALQTLVVGAAWWNKRRGVALATQTVLAIVWQVWGSALRSDAPTVYRGQSCERGAGGATESAVALIRP